MPTKKHCQQPTTDWNLNSVTRIAFILLLLLPLAADAQLSEVMLERGKQQPSLASILSIAPTLEIPPHKLIKLTTDLLEES